MTNLIKVTPVKSTISDNLVYICDETKQPYVNLAQLKIMFPNVDSRTIRRRLKGVALPEVKNAEVPTPGGLQGVALYSQKAVKMVEESLRIKKYKTKRARLRDVYFIGCEELGCFKIGIAVDVEHRLAQLQTACPFRLKVLHIFKKGEKALEHNLHTALADLRLEGEWFDNYALQLIDLT